jgi:hypothetical protein
MGGAAERDEETAPQTAQTAGRSRIWRRTLWRAEVVVRVRELTNRLTAATAATVPLDAPRKEAKRAVEESCKTACEAANCRRGLLGGPVSWWTGDLIATAWEAVHEAEVALVRLETKQAVRANLPWLIYWIGIAIEDGERRRRWVDALEKQERGEVKLDRIQVEQVYREVIVVNSDRYANLRAFRNGLIVVTLILLLLIGGLVIWHAFNDGVMTLCSSERENGQVHCLDGPHSHGWDVGLVALIGAIGGMLAIAFGLAHTKKPPSRYDPRAFQVLLKPVVGAATALAGVLLLQANLLIGPAGNRAESVLLAYALLFGFSQQLFTRFVDKRADDLIEVDGGASKRGPTDGAA